MRTGMTGDYYQYHHQPQAHLLRVWSMASSEARVIRAYGSFAKNNELNTSRK